MRMMFDDYFEFERKEKNLPGDAPENECRYDDECVASGYGSQCCSKTVMYDPETDTKDVTYKCMSKATVNYQVSMVIGDYNLDMECASESGALALAGGVATAAALAAMTLF